MKNVLVNYGGVVLFYIVIIIGILVMNYDSSYLHNNDNNRVSNQIVNTK